MDFKEPAVVFNGFEYGLVVKMPNQTLEWTWRTSAALWGNVFGAPLSSTLQYFSAPGLLQNPKQLAIPNNEHWKIKSWVQIFIFKPQNYTINAQSTLICKSFMLHFLVKSDFLHETEVEYH
jgi:hypothetical protein